jgi:arginyl-tRNA synthetase
MKNSLPLPHGMVRMGGRNGEIITLDELRRRVKRRVKPSLEKDDIVEEWTSEFEDILSGLKWGD